MKLPRDVSGELLARKLRAVGYEVVRQTGSHLRLSTSSNGEHHVTIPAHDPIKVGTLRAVLRAVAAHLGLSVSELLERLDLG